MGDTAATASIRSSKGSRACQLVTERSRCARGWVSVNAAVPGSGKRAGVTTSSGALKVTCGWPPRVLLKVLLCSPVMSAEM